MKHWFSRTFGGYRPVHYSVRVSFYDTLYSAVRWF